ncbi:hypothetical protein [Spiroplasma sp. BIUS-1]|uniref:hypothetical protein n=1 Tax=Spiroplasma sp. BIUS-1 TaxID=216964 RepID=UPI0013979FE6|nr:hypothetical protein [Spiroplasma sp. BIUS-1]QHX36673.1 hypothetical protein SBIUS_v1c04200 [Spiroplasma sp. BIUS-1]
MLKSILLATFLLSSPILSTTQINTNNKNLHALSFDKNIKEVSTKLINHNDEKFNSENKQKIEDLYLKEGITYLDNGYVLENKVIPILNYFQWFAGAESNLQTSQSFSFAKSLYDDKNKTDVKIVGYEALASGPIMLDWVTKIGYSWIEIINEPMIISDLNLVANTGVSYKKSKVHLKGVYNVFKGIRGEIRYKNILGKNRTIAKSKSFWCFGLCNTTFKGAISIQAIYNKKN